MSKVIGLILVFADHPMLMILVFTGVGLRVGHYKKTKINLLFLAPHIKS